MSSDNNIPPIMEIDKNKVKDNSNDTNQGGGGGGGVPKRRESKIVREMDKKLQRLTVVTEESDKEDGTRRGSLTMLKATRSSPSVKDMKLLFESTDSTPSSVGVKKEETIDESRSKSMGKKIINKKEHNTIRNMMFTKSNKVHIEPLPQTEVKTSTPLQALRKLSMRQLLGANKPEPLRMGGKASARKRKSLSDIVDQVVEIAAFDPEKLKTRKTEVKPRYAEKSLGFIPRNNKFRIFCIKLIENKWFDRFILCIIFLNSISLAITDNTVVDPSSQLPVGQGYSIYDLTKPASSIINSIVDVSNTVFTVIFTFECVVKILGMGFFSSPGTYLTDQWNWLDLIVVLTSLLDSFPGVPKVSILRTFRVLRPLRSIHRLPKLRSLVESIFKALPHLVNVAVVLSFACLIFMIFGVQLWRGSMSYRCRLTPEPIILPPELVDTYRWAQIGFSASPMDPVGGAWFLNYLTNRTEFPYCGIPISGPDWTKETSPWSTPQNCAWPVDSGQLNTFSQFPGVTFGVDTDPYGVCSPDSSGRQCPGNGWCGSNYDDYENPRFQNHYILDEPTFQPNIGFGFTGFDSVPAMITVTFQVITTAAWSDIMYTTESFAGIFARFYFMFWCFFGADFLLNLFIAVILDNFEMPERASTTFSRELDKATAEAAHTAEVPKKKEFVEGARKIFKFIADHHLFQGFVILCILLNSVVLAMDEYPIDPERQYKLDMINFFLSIIFMLEMTIKLAAYGPRKYIQDRFNVFDAFIVVTSIVELAVTGVPQYEAVKVKGKVATQGGFITALRALRLFRLFKLARSWTSLQVLLSTMIKTVEDVSNFMLLFFLMIFIFALIGMNLFGNKMHFDEYGYHVDMGYLGYEGCKDRSILYSGPCSWIPRNNFDNLGWAMLTVFQILTTDNWNNVWYDLRRATSPIYAGLYVIPLVIFGQFIMLNIFMSILLVNFETEDDGQVEVKMLDEIAVQKLTALKNAIPLTSPRIEKMMKRINTLQTLRKLKSSRNKSEKVTRVAPLLNSPSGSESGIGRGPGSESSEATIGSPVGSILSPHNDNEHVMTIKEESDLDFTMDEKGLGPKRDSENSLVSRKSEDVSMNNKSMSSITNTNSLNNKSMSSMPKNLGTKKDSDDSLAAGQGSNKSSVVSLSPVKPSLNKKKSSANMMISPRPGPEGTKTEEEKIKEAIRQRKLEELKHSNCEICGKEKKNCICLKHNSLGFLSSTNKLRVFCSRIVHHSQFDNFILFVIFSSSIILCFESPLDPPNGGVKADILNVLNIIFTIIFGVEMILKIITMGLIGHPGAYGRSLWNCLDFTLVILAIVTDINSNSQLQSLRTLRVLRAFRPLRVISRNEGMKLIVNTLFASIPAVGNVMLVVFLFFYIFALLAVNFLKGSMWFCLGMPPLPFTTTTISTFTPLQQYLITYPVPYNELTTDQQGWAQGSYGSNTTATSYDVCLWLGGSWVRNQAQNFDNFFESIGTFFQMTIMEEWTYVMYESIDARGINMQPVRDSQPFWAVYHSIFMLFGAYFCKNIIIGAICDSFNKIKDHLGGSALLTESQKEWIEAQKVIRAAKLRPRLKRLPGRRGQIFDFVTDPLFEIFIMFIITVNVIIMASNYFGEPSWWTVGSEVLNDIFSLVFTTEAVLKLIAFGLKSYFRDPWNCFDFCIVLGSDIGIVVTSTGASASLGGVVSVVRAFRVARVFRLAKRTKGLQQLFDTMILSIPSLINIGFIFFLMMFIFALIGVQLFAKVSLDNGLYNTTHSNFQSVWNAFCVLFKWSTGENADGYMDELAGSVALAVNPQTSNCVPDPPYDVNMCGFVGSNPDNCVPLNGCGLDIAYLFGYSFIFMINYMLKNVFVAVVLEQFGDNDTKEETLNKNTLTIFTELWSERDPEATHFITFHSFSEMIYDLPPPLGAYSMTAKQHRQILLNLDVPILNLNDDGIDYVEFSQVALGLGKYLIKRKAALKGQKLEDIPDVILIKNNQKKLVTPYKVAKSKLFKNLNFSSSHYHAVLVLQRAMRKRKERLKH